jgi:hypothetical protein
MKYSALELKNLIQGFKLSCQTEGKSYAQDDPAVKDTLTIFSRYTGRHWL